MEPRPPLDLALDRSAACNFGPPESSSQPPTTQQLLLYPSEVSNQVGRAASARGRPGQAGAACRSQASSNPRQYQRTYQYTDEPSCGREKLTSVEKCRGQVAAPLPYHPTSREAMSPPADTPARFSHWYILGTLGK
ncbi:hypothetical protein GGTG_03665 [Gaeumannomyces tritici R3-111a-1]|uniref:Uncharacterized protein n=1 Tax=Gaeumannomyces tritici (strain R3-111a-1) TaxID=644352 RepID=J3NQV9_GAET3|nr:hypothetical protein GGTG_03665 [Gaeumannomyces tritici R3-111a-1]EJT78565.1 hypothetical protein GGTG_03665 [Gaeumannomyces tritici R3-111a-1]